MRFLARVLLVAFAALIWGCGPTQAELSRFVEAAVAAIHESPETLDRFATTSAIDEIDRYRGRMKGRVRVLGWDYADDEKVCTVQFDEGDAFWFILKEEEGEIRIAAIQPVDLEEGRPTL